MQDECSELIDRNYPMLRISLAYANQELRPKLLALYGLLGTIEQCLYHASDPVVSNAKLAWWHEELRQAKGGKGNHPLSLQLNSSGALAAWPEALLERVFNLATERVEALAVNDASGLQLLCESLGLIHLELEAALQQVPVPDQKVIRQLATSNGLMQLFRESFKASHTTYYWVPLGDCARLGIERLQIAQNSFRTEIRQVFIDITIRILDQKRVLQNFALLTELPPTWAARCRHWLLLSLLHQRQLLLLQSDLAKPGLTGDIKRCLQQVRMSDSWFAWHSARLLNATGKASKE